MKQTTRRIELDGRQIILLGTAHISRESITEVTEAIATEQPDMVCVELDEARLQTVRNEKGWQELDITKVLKEGKGFLLIANLVLASFQKRMGADVGVKPGEEMKEAINAAEAAGIPVSMVDRPVQITLRRAWAKSGFWGRSKLLAALLSSAFSSEELKPEEIEGLKEQGAMEGMMEELAEYLPAVKEVLIDERDRYLASKIWQAGGSKSLAVLGAGHLNGTEEWIKRLARGETTPDTSDIAEVPPSGPGSKIAGIAFPLVLIGLIVAGFFTGGFQTSVDMAIRWLLWNGSLAALGTIVALGHPLAVLTAFLGAPVATINPVIGVGMFSGLVQAWIRKPRVLDMEHLQNDISSVRGFYKNRISHILLIFFLSSLGGAIGNFIAVPALVSSLIK